MREEVELLEDDPDLLSHGRDVDALARDLLALEEDPSLVQRLQQVHAAKQRALAAAARPDDDQYLARVDGEVDPFEHDVVAEALAHALEPDDGRVSGHGTLVRVRRNACCPSVTHWPQGSTLGTTLVKPRARESPLRAGAEARRRSPTPSDTPRRERGETAQERLEEEEAQEDIKERLEREHGELLEELRSLIPGAEVLLGFLLAIIFTEKFDLLTDGQRYVYYVTLVSTAAAIVCFLAPAAHHRIPLPRRGQGVPGAARATARRSPGRSPRPSR